MPSDPELQRLVPCRAHAYSNANRLPLTSESTIALLLLVLLTLLLHSALIIVPVSALIRIAIPATPAEI